MRDETTINTNHLLKLQTCSITVLKHGLTDIRVDRSKTGTPRPTANERIMMMDEFGIVARIGNRDVDAEPVGGVLEMLMTGI